MYTTNTNTRAGGSMWDDAPCVEHRPAEQKLEQWMAELVRYLRHQLASGSTQTGACAPPRQFTLTFVGKDDTTGKSSRYSVCMGLAPGPCEPAEPVSCAPPPSQSCASAADLKEAVHAVNHHTTRQREQLEAAWPQSGISSDNVAKLHEEVHELRRLTHAMHRVIEAWARAGKVIIVEPPP